LELSVLSKSVNAMPVIGFVCLAVGSLPDTVIDRPFAAGTLVEGRLAWWDSHFFHAGGVRGTNSCVLAPLPGCALSCKGHQIGIGAAVARRPLPHHRAYGSVHGGSRSLNLTAAI